MSTPVPSAPANGVATTPGGEARVRVLVIGGGFAGIGVSIALERAGVGDFTVLEKGSELGGTWRDNTYPGCACDVPSSLYSFSFEQNPEWSNVFAKQPEIQDYLLGIARKYGVERRVRLDTEVLSADWDGADQCWIVETSRGTLLADVLVAASGPLHEPVIPSLPGIDEYAGTSFHSARWRHDHDLTGERVAVVGTGSSAIQFVPEITPRVGRLHLFQRTAPWVLPKLDHEIPGVEKALFRRAPLAQRAWRELLYHALELVQLAQRRPRVMAQIQRLGLQHLRRQVRDPELRRILTPHFVLGCKRLLLSNSYYPALTQPHVDVVPHGVSEVRERSIVDSEGVEREIDTIIFGTGFRVTDPPIADRVRGADGRLLSEVWQGSPQAYLGTNVSGFPNLFMTIGPNIANGHTSALVLIEAQMRYIVESVAAMDRERLASLDVRADVQQRYNEKVQQALRPTVWNAGGCASYYLDRNGRNSSIYPWTTIDLRRRMRSIDLDSYETSPVRSPEPAEAGLAA